MSVEVTYDPSADAAYLYLREIEPGGAKRTYACDPNGVSGEIMLDFDGEGRLIGVEVLAASHKLPQDLLKTATILS